MTLMEFRARPEAMAALLCEAIATHGRDLIAALVPTPLTLTVINGGDCVFYCLHLGKPSDARRVYTINSHGYAYFAPRWLGLDDFEGHVHQCLSAVEDLLIDQRVKDLCAAVACDITEQAARVLPREFE